MAAVQVEAAAAGKHHVPRASFFCFDALMARSGAPPSSEHRTLSNPDQVVNLDRIDLPGQGHQEYRRDDSI
jgi:hypothetical protein